MMTLDSGLLFWGHPVYTISEKMCQYYFLIRPWNVGRFFSACNHKETWRKWHLSTVATLLLVKCTSRIWPFTTVTSYRNDLLRQVGR